MKNTKYVVSLIALAGSCCAMTAFAQDIPETGNAAQGEEAEATARMSTVIVSSQRREQRLQDVPIAVSAFSASSIEASKIDTLADFNARVPNASLSPVGAFTFASAFSIRGLGFADVESTFEPTVGVEIDGVYLARNVGAQLDMFDVESVEILRGPQGTLYGRNTIGGVVSVRSARPTGEPGGKLQLTLGNYGRTEFRGSAEAPLNDVLSAKVSGLIKNYDGYYENSDSRKFPNNSTSSFRGMLAYEPSGDFDATLIADYTKLDDSGLPFKNVSLPTQVLSLFGFPGSTGGDPYKTDIGKAQGVILDTWGLTLEMNKETSLGTLTSITGYRETDNVTQGDFDGEQVQFLQVDRDETHDQISQEIRLAGEAGKWNYVVGTYLFNQSYDIDIHQYGTIFGSPTAGSHVLASQDNTAAAVFGQVDYEIIEGLTLTGGLRFSWEKKDFTVQPLFVPTSQDFSEEFDDLSPRLGLSYQANRDLMLYASYSKGFRAGGFNGRAGSFAVVGPYDSETVSSYEAGFKSQFFEDALTLNVGAFLAEYQDQQLSVQEINPVTLINQTLVQNAADSQISGFEIETELRPGGGFTFYGSLGYLDAGFDTFVADLGDGQGKIDRSNLPLSYAPEWTGGLTGQWAGDTSWGEITAQASILHQSSQYTSFTPLNATTDLFIRPDNTRVNASLALHKQNGVTFRLWGKNLTDETVINNTFAVGSLLSGRLYQPPREFGIDIGYEF